MSRTTLAWCSALSTLFASLWPVRLASAATLEVGPTKTFAKPCDAVQAAADGDTIEIDAAGTYDGDVCAISKNGLTLRGTGGRAKIDAAGKNIGGKGTWVISGHDTTVENVEFSGAAVPDKNGAGIRQEGDNLTVRGCYFHDNEDGILTGASATSQIVVEFSEFAANGAGDGFSHNMYIGNVARFTLRGSYSHDAKVGHLVKSRAAENYILYNRLTGESGTSSYEIDLPNGGTSYVIGNLVEQGPSTGNSTIVAYGEEGVVAGNPGHALFVVNNTIVNDRSAGGTFVNVGAAITTPARLQNNIFLGPGNVTSQSTAALTTNFAMGDPKLANAAAYDYRLTSGSPCVDAGSDPGMGEGFSLAPTSRYAHPAGLVGRTNVGVIDIGAYELGDLVDAGIAGSGGAAGAGSGGAAGAMAGAGGVDPGDSGNPDRDAGASAPGVSEHGCECKVGRRAYSGAGFWGSWLALACLRRRVVTSRRRTA